MIEVRIIINDSNFFPWEIWFIRSLNMKEKTAKKPRVLKTPMIALRKNMMFMVNSIIKSQPTDN